MRESPTSATVIWEQKILCHLSFLSATGFAIMERIYKSDVFCKFKMGDTHVGPTSSQMTKYFITDLCCL